ncbi:MAG: hypothetical protein H2066_05380 [Candidatus Poseidoniales archaeon]|nr:hypothetical protein [Candidatus Poseidoniales archaeon]
MSNTIIADLVDGECIISAALMDPQGFTIERTSSDFKPTVMNELLDLSDDSNLVTLVGENSTVIICKLESGHAIVIQCPNGANLGKARQKLSRSSIAIIPFL